MLAACLVAGIWTPGLQASGELAQYVLARDASYSWHEVGSGRVGSASYTELILTSQTWRNITWKHQLFVFRPAGIESAPGQASARQALLFIDGGRWTAQYENGQQKLPGAARIFARLAESIQAPVAVVRQVPFQPLFGRTEDTLIAYTFDRYLQTGEADWPLLLPMVASAMRAMDAVQEFARQRWQMQIERFTVAGASKRGWTSWLTAAVDPRVAGVAPMVINMLDMPAQIELQRATFGGLSQEVRDYEDIDLPARIDSERGRRLVAMVDPYSYRERLRAPKLILLGTNDRYWPLDALKLYWSGLREPKRVLYLPNQGHSLKDYDRLLGSLGALHRYSQRGEELPQVSWKFTANRDTLVLDVHTDRQPRRIRAWTATSATRDFRDARWTRHACKRAGNGFVCSAPAARERYTAMYAEVGFKDRGAPAFSLSTDVCIYRVEPAAPQDHAEPACAQARFF